MHVSVAAGQENPGKFTAANITVFSGPYGIKHESYLDEKMQIDYCD